MTPRRSITALMAVALLSLVYGASFERLLGQGNTENHSAPLLARLTTFRLRTPLKALQLREVGADVGAPSDTAIPQTSCPTALPRRLVDTRGSDQLIFVVTPAATATSATLTAWQRVGTCWRVAYGPYRAWVGHSGISAHKHEGDGSTPAGIFSFASTMYGNDPNPGVRYTYRRLRCGDWWDEDSASRTYDTFQVVRCSQIPPFDNGASEALWTEGAAYPFIAVINSNPSRTPGAGSAIFLHASLGVPTAGCVSLTRKQLVDILTWMNPNEHPRIVIGTSATIVSY
ncbi:MAG TPA: L,D-transpeptidase family protein [Acidimicrobiales bacterium]|nr:L,D-transpeptidase family protein [Acidimicrobiales bacterium]